MKQSLLFYVLLTCAGFLAERLPARPFFHNQGEIKVSISPPSDAHICGISSVKITFVNNSPSSVIIPNITVSLDNTPDENITFKEMLPSPGFDAVSGWGTSNPVFRYPAPLDPGNKAELNLSIQFSCAFFNIQQLNGYTVRVNGQGQTKLTPIVYYPFDVTSDSYVIGRAIITPAFNLSTIFAQYEKPFSMIVPLEVSGDYCDDDFTVQISGLPACLNVGDATYSVIRNDVAYGHLPLAPTQYSGGFLFEIKAKQLGIPAFCQENYPGGMGEIKLLISNVRFNCGCGTPDAFYPVTFGFTPCGDDEAPDDCKEFGHVTPLSTTIQQVFLKSPAAGNLEITNISSPSAPFSICATDNTLILDVKNAGPAPAYFIDLDFANSMGYEITGIQLNGVTYKEPFQPGPHVHLDLGNNHNPAYGLSDLNGDQVYEELHADDHLEIKIKFVSGEPNHCGIGDNDPCSPNCHEVHFDSPAVSATATCSDACHLKVNSAVYEHNLKIKPFYNIVKTNGTVIQKDLKETVTLELTSGKLDGFSGYLDQGGVQHFICIQSNLPASAITLDNIIVNGSPTSITFDPNGYADLGPIDPAHWNPTTIQFDVNLDLAFCPPDKQELILKIRHGIYFEGCPNCYITLACNEAKYLLPCTIDDPCKLFDALFSSAYNSVYEGFAGAIPTPLKVYPCDDIVLNVNALVLENRPGQPLMIGVVVAPEYTNYFEGLSDYQLTVTDVDGNAYPIDLSSKFVVGVPGKPYRLVFFIGTSDVDILSTGNEISGYIKLHMANTFYSQYDKVEYFAPALGAVDGNAIDFCKDAYIDLYALDVWYDLDENTNASCHSGGVYTAQLTKLGGEIFGPDFPGIPRIAAQFTSHIDATLPQGYEFFSPGTCERLGNAVQIDAKTLSIPTGYESHGQLLQSFSLSFEENCTGSTPVTIGDMIAFRPGSDCSEMNTHQVIQSDPLANFPNIESRFDPLVWPEEAVQSNTFTLNTFATNTGGDASEAWIQLEYNPQHISINLASITGGFSGAPVLIDNNDPAHPKQALIIPIGALGDNHENLMQSMLLNFLDQSCNGTEIHLYGYHRCRCQPLAAYHFSSEYDISVCKDSESRLKLDFPNGGLDLSAEICGDADSECHNFSLSVNISNNNLGNAEGVTLQLDLPANLYLINAEYIAEGFGDCSADGIPINPTGILDNGWTIPGNMLPGVLSGASDQMRERHLQLYFAGCGDPNDRDLTLRCWGTSPCGTRIEKQAVFSDLIHPFSLNTAITLEKSLQYSCNTKTGAITLTITADPNWPDNGMGTITLSSPDVSFNLPGGNVIAFNQSPFTVGPISFTNINPDKCAFEISALVQICADVECVSGTGVCPGICTSKSFTYSFPGSAAPNSLVFAPNFCSGSPATVGAVISVQSGYLPQIIHYTHARFFCDLNNNGMADAGEPLLYTASPLPSGILTRVGQGSNQYQGNITIYNVAAFIAACNGGNVVVVFDGLSTEGSCICATPAAGHLCCNCIGAHGRASKADASGLSSAVYPNPSTGLFTLALEPTENGLAAVIIFNALGEEVYHSIVLLEQGITNERQIDLSNLPAGLYSLHIHTATGNRQHLIVKQ